MRQRLSKLRMRRGDTVADYIERFEKIVREFEAMDETTALSLAEQTSLIYSIVVEQRSFA